MRCIEPIGGGGHYKITGKDSNNKVSYIGGWQNNRQMGMHDRYRFVENVFEELDAPGEWFYDADKQTIYFYPPKDIDIKNAKIEIVRLRHLIEFKGSKKSPVKFINLKGLTFRHAARTFMDTKEPLLRSDWTIYRGGAVVFDGAEDCSISNSEFDQLGGNSIFVNKYNRRITIRACHIHDSGASAICFVGDPDAVRNPLFEYNQKNNYDKIDKARGPKTDNYPADCLVDDCLINDIGIFEKQATGVQLSMAKGITIRHCSIYDVGRAGINISEGTFGGHIIEFCDVFDTVRETGDHGSFNSWGRDRFWHLRGAPEEKLPELALLDVEKNIIRNSRWRCDHGWDVDLDDGSSNYEIYNNLFLRGGLKLREGFHRKVYNNIAINNSLHPHVWYNNSQDVITGNIWMGAYRPAGGMPSGKWGKMVDRNLFIKDSARKSYSKHGCDLNSIAGDPMFINPNKGDFRVKKGSPAFKIGFKNFPMDKFGVQNAKLKAIAQTPLIPELANTVSKPVARTKAFYWQGATVKPISEEEFSAFGVSKDDGGLHLVNVSKDSVLEKAGLKSGDLIQAVNKRPVKTAKALQKITNSEAGKPLIIDFVRNQAKSKVTLSGYAYTVVDTCSNDKFKVVPLDNPASIEIKNITTKPRTNNQAVEVLFDNKLAKTYGPVFSNNTNKGLYKIDLKKVLTLKQVNSWSFRMGERGHQSYTLYGSNSKRDPGWKVKDSKLFTPIAIVSTKGLHLKQFTAVSIRTSNSKGIGDYRWLVWQTFCISGNNENTAFQEFQILTEK